jgi:hypothetical protein
MEKIIIAMIKSIPKKISKGIAPEKLLPGLISNKEEGERNRRGSNI